ncbi:cytoplasmic protein [Devosia insulae DS-56]|uniref:Cytoplasmic protein n=1 Tax=Devosia insulae DS-56 TaxID=1116389 RepID=A0A1E5XHL5_9HYPH|nr:glutamine amidotransferase [Devosia insulae]OEO28087.1 cytoplasmic protein [Devosia insulae DS-56]
MSKRVLIAGESWVTHSIHTKGFDSFTTTEYNEGVRWLKAALEGGGWEVTFLPNHLAARDFPQTAEALAAYDVVMLSDIGANTLLLHPDTFVRSVPLPNRLTAIKDYVLNGGGLVMIGGYLTFQGIDAKGQYAGTAIEDVLPVTLSRHDDRRENPQGVAAHVGDPGHPITKGIAGEWPALLGYNEVVAKPDAEVLVRVGGDPLIAVAEFGKGRSVVFTSDCGPHWAPPPFVDWAGYAPLWNNIANWVSGK